MTMVARVRSSLIGLENNPRIQYVALGLITLLAAGLRFYKLGEWSFAANEMETIGHALAHYSSLELTIHNIPPSRNWVPLSVILTGGVLNAFGTTEWNARLVSAVIGVLSIPLLYLPVRRVLNPRVGLIAALLLAVSPWHLFWSQSARFYTALMLVFSLAVFAFFFGLERDLLRYFLVFFVLLYLAASERLLALFIVPVLVCYLFALKVTPLEKPGGLRARNLWLLALPGVAFGAWEIYNLVARSSITAGVVDTFVGQVTHTPVRLVAATIYRIGLPLICVGTAGGVALLVQKKRAGLFLCSAALVPFLALLGMVSFISTDARYAFVSLPFWITLSAVALHQLLVRTDKVGKILSVGVLLLLVAHPLSEDLLYYQYQHGNRSDWRTAYSLVEQRKEKDDLVLTTIPAIGHYYLGDEVKWIHSMDSESIQAVGHRVWLLIDEGPGYVAPDLKQWVRENSELIHVFELSEPGNSMSIYIYLYDPARTSTSEIFPRICVGATAMLLLVQDG